MNSLDQITKLINHLADDEDQRQDLWVHYLSDRSIQSLTSYAKKLQTRASLEQEFQALLWYAFKNPPSDKFSKLISKLSEIEQSIACLLALGLTIGQISKYKGITEIRIKQVISVMKDNDCWEELYAEEKIDRGRTPRSE